jgi:hypothetical protein
MSRPDRAGEDLRATLAARGELGPDYEPALVESFLDRIEERIDDRVDRRVSERLPEVHRQDRSGGPGETFWLAVASLGFGIPISGIAAGTAEVEGLLVAWAGIAAVNFAHAWSSRRHRS